MALYDDHDIPCTELRVLPTGGSSNALLSHKGYLKELAYRKERNKELGDAFKFDLPLWDDLKVYDTE